MINRVPTQALENITPYECLREKKPHLGHLRVFGCLAYSKIDSTKLKKLDDRSQSLVHLGIETGSKAYRLFNPETQRIVVSRDVVFDETRGWNWNEITSGPRMDPGMFQMKWGDVIDTGEGPVLTNDDQEDEADENENNEEE